MASASPPARLLFCREGGYDGVPLRAHPGADFALGLGLGEAVALLQPVGQFVAPAVDAGDVLVGQLDPVELELALELQPVALNLVPTHRRLPCQWRELSRCDF